MCFLWSAAEADDLVDELVDGRPVEGRQRGREGWSSTPALLYTRHSDISACGISSIQQQTQLSFEESGQDIQNYIYRINFIHMNKQIKLNG